MNYLCKTTQKKSHFVLFTSDNSYCHQHNIPNPSDFIDFSISRSQSQPGTDSYTRSLRRSFSYSKLLAFFNPDLTQFITLTYKQNDNTPQQIIQDIKYLIKQTIRQQQKQQQKANNTLAGNFLENSLNSAKPLKYIYILERQKRGSIHVHMIATEGFEYVINKNGYRSLKHWTKGFSSVLTIDDLDSNFKPYLYLFKYMYKTERVGKSFIHVSKNFDKITNVDYADYINKLTKEGLIFSENFQFKIDEVQHTINKSYYKV